MSSKLVQSIYWSTKNLKIESGLFVPSGILIEFLHCTTIDKDALAESINKDQTREYPDNSRE